MKNTLTAGLAGLALAASLSMVAGGSLKPGRTAASDVVPADEILTTVRSMGFTPIGDPLRRGPYYLLHAYEPGGIEVRVVADAELGDILSITPVRPPIGANPSLYERAPHIIHIPQGD